MLQTVYFMLNRPEPIRQSSLLMVLASGIDDRDVLLTGLRSLALESQSPWSDRISCLQSLLAQGQSLSEALSGSEQLLPDQTCMAIRVGETSGTLKQVLADEAQRLTRSCESPAMMGGGFSMLIGWAIGLGLITKSIVAFVMMFIIPKHKKIFSDFGTDLPALTEMLISVSDWFLNYWYLLSLPVATVVILAVKFGAKSANAQLTAGRPLAAGYFPRLWAPAILRMLAVAASAQRPLAPSLQLIAAEMDPGRTRVRLAQACEEMLAGTSCWEALRTRGFLTRREAVFLDSANTSGHLDWGLVHLSRGISSRRGRWLYRLVCIMQPAITLTMGFVVMFVTVGLFLPLVKLINDLS